MQQLQETRLWQNRGQQGLNPLVSEQIHQVHLPLICMLLNYVGGAPQHTKQLGFSACVHWVVQLVGREGLPLD